jgi:hypothetical protein
MNNQEKYKLIKKLHEDTKLILNGSWENWLEEKLQIRKDLEDLTPNETDMMLCVIKEKIINRFDYENNNHKTL